MEGCKDVGMNRLGGREEWRKEGMKAGGMKG